MRLANACPATGMQPGHGFGLAALLLSTALRAQAFGAMRNTESGFSYQTEGPSSTRRACKALADKNAEKRTK